MSYVPKSQHRPIIFLFGLYVSLVDSKPEPRWNFQRAIWVKFSKNLDNKLINIPCTISNYTHRGFCKAYTPGWNKTCTDLYNQYQTAPNTQTAHQLLDELDPQRKKNWKGRTAQMNFKQSSRKAWNLLHKLGSETNPLTATTSSASVTANNIAT